jgi:KDO2-lipid IV(A) lauroyltransferase
MKKFRYFLEYLLVKYWLITMKCLSLEKASDFASKFFKFIGIKLKVSKVAYENIKMIFPNMGDNNIRDIILDVWDNFGRMAAETPIFLDMEPEKLAEYVNIIGIENLQKVKNKKAMFFTAHMANWEVASKALEPYGARFHAVYRAANNKLVDKLINDLRKKIDMPMIPKGKGGARQLIEVIKNNEHIVMLVDQKMNDGIRVPFMGRDAMTAPAIATLSLKYDCPIIPIQVIRKDKYYFDIIIHPQLEYVENNVEAIMLQINNIIGDWVSQNPGQWFWLHRRWIKE